MAIPYPFAPTALRAQPLPLTRARLQEIADVMASHRADAVDDIEDKRDVYLALLDLLNGLGTATGAGRFPQATPDGA